MILQFLLCVWEIALDILEIALYILEIALYMLEIALTWPQTKRPTDVLIYIYICILWCFYHRWIVAIGLYIIYIYILCYRVTPHIYIYILCTCSIYNMLSGSPPYVYIYIYIYYLIGSPTHTHTHLYIYIYTLTPITLPLSHHSRNSRLLLLLAGCCYTFEEMEEMQASANVPICDIYIYIKVYIYVNIYRFII